MQKKKREKCKTGNLPKMETSNPALEHKSSAGSFDGLAPKKHLGREILLD
jgi:hypothetical protein